MRVAWRSILFSFVRSCGLGWGAKSALFVALFCVACGGGRPGGDDEAVVASAITRTPANFPATTAVLDVTLPPLTAAEQAVLAFGARTALKIDDRGRTTGLAASAGTVTSSTARVSGDIMLWCRAGARGPGRRP